MRILTMMRARGRRAVWPGAARRRAPRARAFVVGADAVALAARAGDALVEEDSQFPAIGRGASKVAAGAPREEQRQV